MPAPRLTIRSLLLATALCAPWPAFADLTPEALWQSWQDRAEQSGHDLGAEVVQGGTLSLRGLRLSRPLGDGTVTAVFDRLDMARDGADVRLTLTGGQQITVTADPAEGETNTAVFRLGDTPLTITARGDIADPEYTLAGDRLSADLVSLDQGGEPVDADMRIDLAGLAGTLSGLASTDQALSADLTATSLATEISARDPETGSALRNTATQSDIRLRADLAGAETGAPWSLTAWLESADAQSVSLQTGPDGSLETDSSQATSRLALTLTELRADYSVALTGLATTVTGSMLPMGSIALAMGAADLSVSVPNGATDSTQTARIDMRLGDVTAGETVWALFDPSGAIPRDPAQLALTAEADIDITDPDADMPSLLPRALRIGTFDLTVGGAQMQGNGAATFPEGPGGIPDLGQPIGQFDLSAQGLAGLLQQAMTAGAISMEQAMGAQMMLGMFAVQGQGDTLTTRIEAGPGGTLMVNGNQLR